MKILNMTPHTIVVDDGKKYKEYKPCGEVARVIVESEVVGEVDKYPVVKNVVKGHNLPDQKEGVFLIVSAMVLAQLPERTDLIAPNTNEAKRNDKGHIVSVPGFVKA